MSLPESDFLPSRRWQVRRRIHSAETLGWRQGLDKKLKQAREFYTLNSALDRGGCRAGLHRYQSRESALLDGRHQRTVSPLPFAILVVASDKKIMQDQPSSRQGWSVVTITTVAMFAAGVAMFVV